MVRSRPKPPKRSVFEPSLPTFLEEQGFSTQNARRIWEHLLDRPDCSSFSDVPGLPAKLIAILERDFVVSTSSVRHADTAPDGTVKLLIALHDGSEVEAVVINQGGEGGFASASRMRMRAGATLCVSSQVGCRMGCTFCATGTLGLSGNLEAYEVVEQLKHAHSVRHDVRRIVFMGMGEPLENYRAVSDATRLLTSRSGTFRLVERPITISTVGAPRGGISKLVDDNLAGTVRLALSLHAPSQDLRKEIVPSAQTNPLPELMAEVDRFYAAASQAGRKARLDKVLVEYCVLAGVNDGAEIAHKLGELLGPRKDAVMLNLIPYNPVPGKPFNAPSDDDVNKIYWIVSGYGVRVHARRRLGGDVAAACGQLAKASLKGSSSQADVEDLATSTCRSSAAVHKASNHPKQNKAYPAELLKAPLLVAITVAALAAISVGLLRSQRLSTCRTRGI